MTSCAAVVTVWVNGVLYGMTGRRWRDHAHTPTVRVEHMHHEGMSLNEYKLNFLMMKGPFYRPGEIRFLLLTLAAFRRAQ
jgi:hypothetical protein